MYAGLFLPDGRADFPALVRRKSVEGVHVRLLYGAPDSEAVARRGAEEGVGDDLAARIRLSLSYMRSALDAPNVEARLHDSTLYNSIYRYDEEMLVNTHIYGIGAPNAPVLHLRRMPGGRLFEQYAASFERVWESAKPVQTEVGREAEVELG